MPTFTLRVPASCTVSIDGATEVSVAIVGDEVTLTVTTPPERRVPPAPIPEWDGPTSCRFVPPEYWQHDPRTEPTGIEPVGPWDGDVESENDPWLRGR